LWDPNGRKSSISHWSFDIFHLPFEDPSVRTMFTQETFLPRVATEFHPYMQKSFLGNGNMMKGSTTFKFALRSNSDKSARLGVSGIAFPDEVVD